MRNTILATSTRRQRFLACASACVLALTVTLSGCAQARSPKSSTTLQGGESTRLKKVVCVLDWTPNTNHTGLFLARDLGAFREEGLDVSIQQGDMNAIEMVGSGSATFGIASQEQVLQARTASGRVPIVSIAAIVQHNTSGFASLADRHITSPRDFAGKTYSGWGTELERAFIASLMRKDGGDPKTVKVITESATDFIASMKTGADFAWIYYGWDGINAKLKHVPINFIRLQDIDPRIDFYSPTFITNERTIAHDPDVVKRFLRAAKKGYETAIADPKRGVEALMKAAPELDRALVTASQAYLNTKYIDDAPRWGEMTDARWTSFSAWMISQGLLPKNADVKAAYTRAFIP